MAYTTIKKPSDYFNTKLYTGNGSEDHTISGVGFQSDLTWLKSRSSAISHMWTDAVRGNNKVINSNTADAETTFSSLKSWNADGFVLSNNSNFNGNGVTFASWNWKANGTGVANTDGSISSTVSANTTAGFSIVKYTSTGTANSTIGHGLNAAPTNVIIKCTSDGATSWISKMKGADGYLYLDTTGALTANSTWLPTSSNTITLTNTWGAYNTSGRTYIAYCFAEKQGFSKFGSYTGNGNADGSFIYTGFKPAFVIVKRTDAIQGWYILDNKRNTFNPEDKYLETNDSDAEATFTFCDFLSNGFKTRTTGTGFNASGGSYIYMAFASEPLIGDNPATAR